MATAGPAFPRPGAAGGSLEARPSPARRCVETDDAHRATERAFDLDRRLTSLAGYGNALQALDAFVVTERLSPS